MFKYKKVAQITVCLNSMVVDVLERIAKEGKFKNVESLVESMLFEIALDEMWLRKQLEFDKNKSSAKQQMSVA